MSTILVTGATGFLGGTLVRRLADEGADVFATGRDVAKLAKLPLRDDRKLALNLAKQVPGEVVAQLPDVRAIVHCAGLASAWGRDAEFELANVGATEHVIALAQRLGVDHLVHISSPSIYFRFEDQLNVAEDLPLPKPINAYARTKVIAEERLRASGLPFTILRPRGIYGLGDTALLPRLLRAAEAGPLPRLRKGVAATDITHVSDVVEAIVTSLRQRVAAVGQAFNISGGQALMIREIVDKVCAAHSFSARWHDLPVRPVLAAVRLGETIARLRPGQPEPRVTAYGFGIFAYSQTLDLTKAHRYLGWTPRVPFEDGLARTFFDPAARAP
jgi:nucleoside-diphosphate-sugar epimerase